MRIRFYGMIDLSLMAPVLATLQLGCNALRRTFDAQPKAKEAACACRVCSAAMAKSIVQTEAMNEIAVRLRNTCKFY